jgi:hypothetical protein
MKHKTVTFGEAATSPAVIRELYKEGMARERRLLDSSYANVKEKWLAYYKDVLFTSPVFWPYTIGGFQPFEKTFHPSHNRFTYSVARSGGEKSSIGKWRYFKLLRLLRREKDAEMRLLLLARWLKQEGVCEPEKFLPKPIIDRLVQRFFRSRRISPTALSYWAVITGWKAYFVRLQAAVRNVRSEDQDRESVLQKQGFTLETINYAIAHKNSVLSAVMHWIGERRHIELATLRNAYSKR